MKENTIRSGLRSLLDSKNVNFLKTKLELGEITPDECKEVMKRIILKKYGRIKNRSFRASILGFGRSLNNKIPIKS